jgi:inner membrane protein
MPSAPTHAAVALALAPVFWRPGAPRRIWVLGALFAMAPDLDVAGFALGVPYDAPLGHRGFTHSLACAALVAVALAWLALPRASPAFSRRRAALYLFLAIGSHGLLDMLTDGGLGIALWSPFENGRHFFAFRPIAVSPIGVHGLLGERGLAILSSELRWVWLPAALFAASVLALRARSRRDTAR